MMAAVTSTLPRERVGPYRLVRLLGKGGMGAVYEAIQEPIERRVAIKILHGRYAQEPEIATRFFNEARAVNLVDHPGIVQISDYGQLPSGVAFLVMEYLKGETLTQYMKRNGGKLGQPEALRLSRQLAAALAAAHEKGIIHRDLKPDNIMLIIDTDPEAMGRVRAKLLDFGIAKVVADLGKENATHTAADVVMGTPKYMSPEQCRGAANVDDKSDVYALGAMMYEMLAGRAPFLGATGEILAKQIYEAPPPLTSLSQTVTPDAVALIERLLKKNKAERPSMRQVAVELERMTAPYPTMAHPIVLPPQALLTPSSGTNISTVNEEEVDFVTDPSLATRVRATPEPDSQPGKDPPSTLGFSVGQSSLSMRSPTRWRRWLFPAGAVLLVVAAILSAVAFRGRTKPVPATALPQAGVQTAQNKDEPQGLIQPKSALDAAVPNSPTPVSAPSVPPPSVPSVPPSAPTGPAVKPGPTAKPSATPPINPKPKRPFTGRPIPSKPVIPPHAKYKIVD